VKRTRPSTTAPSRRVSAAESPALAANAGSTAATNGSALASLRTVTFTLDTTEAMLERDGGTERLRYRLAPGPPEEDQAGTEDPASE
jgi:hypothetical protein